MQIYNNKNSKTKSNGSPKRSCSYCCDTEHVVTDCPNAVNDWAFFQRHEIPLKGGSSTHWTIGARTWHNGAKINHWFREPREWGRWYEACEKAINKINKAKVKAKQAGKKRVSKCGFCGATDHNRRDCDSMKQFKQRLLEANRGWRQRFYDKFVGELGLSIGAVVNVDVLTSWGEPNEQKIGIIESINWDQLSMFCYTLQGNGWRNRLRDDFRQNLEVMVNVEGVSHKLKFGGSNGNIYSQTEHLLKDDFGTLADYFGWRRSEAAFVSTIARSETPLDEEWVNQGHEDAMDFLIKKYSMEKLKEWNVPELLKKVEKANEQKKLQLSA